MWCCCCYLHVANVEHLLCCHGCRSVSTSPRQDPRVQWFRQAVVSTTRVQPPSYSNIIVQQQPVFRHGRELSLGWKVVSTCLLCISLSISRHVTCLALELFISKAQDFIWMWNFAVHHASEF